MTTADDKRLQDQVNAANNAGAGWVCACWYDPMCPACMDGGCLIDETGRIEHVLGCSRCTATPPLPADATPPDTRSEVETLRHWKAEAMTVLAEWDQVFDALGGGRLGESKAAASLDQVQRLTARHDADIAAAKAAAWETGHMLGEALAYNALGDMLWAKHREVITSGEYAKAKAARLVTLPHWGTNPYRALTTGGEG